MPIDYTQYIKETEIEDLPESDSTFVYQVEAQEQELSFED